MDDDDDDDDDFDDADADADDDDDDDDEMHSDTVPPKCVWKVENSSRWATQYGYLL